MFGRAPLPLAARVWPERRDNYIGPGLGPTTVMTDIPRNQVAPLNVSPHNTVHPAHAIFQEEP